MVTADLHVSPTTLATCLDVLREVQRLAVAHGAQVAILGDFFHDIHTKGAVPVHMLNTLLTFFREEWHVITRILVGNHDMADQDEKEHGLHFLHAANPRCITIVDTPTFDDDLKLLWMPFVRDSETLRALMASFESRGTRLIFAHLDTKGAVTGGSHCSDVGVEAQPAGVAAPIIAGHYHMAQTLGAVTYVGSPFQTNLSEHGSAKRLLLVSFACGGGTHTVESIPIDIGPHFYRVEASDLAAVGPTLRPGDTAVVTLPPGTRSAGTDVVVAAGVHLRFERAARDLTVITDSAAARAHAAAVARSDTCISLLEAFCQWRSSGDAGEGSVDAGAAAVLRRLATASDGKAQVGSKFTAARSVRAVTLTLCGFGPFRDTLRLELRPGHLSVVYGQRYGGNVDHSNGVGKSLLTAGALLWVLTGTIDERLCQVSATPCVIWGDGLCASVEVALVVDGSLQVLHVRRSAHRKSPLDEKVTHRLHLASVCPGGTTTNLTCATMHATQKALAETLGCDSGGEGLRLWLQHVAVAQQMGSPDVVASGPADAKRILNNLAGPGLLRWQAIVETARADVAATEASLVGCTARVALLLALEKENVERAEAARSAERLWAEKAGAARHRCEEARAVASAELRALDIARLRAEASAVAAQHRSSEAAFHAVQRARERELDEQLLALAAAAAVALPESVVPIDNGKLRAAETELAEAEDVARRTKARRDECTFALVTSKCATCTRAFRGGPEEQLDLKRKLEQAMTADRSAAERSAVLARVVDAIRTEIARSAESVRAETKRAASTRAADIERRRASARASWRVQDAEYASLRASNQRRAQQADNDEATARALERNVRSAEESLRAAEHEVRHNPHSATTLLLDAQRMENAAALMEQRTLETAYARDLAHLREAVRAAGNKNHGIQSFILAEAARRLADGITDWAQRIFGEPTARFSCSWSDGASGELLRRFQVREGHQGVLSGGQIQCLRVASVLALRGLTPNTFSTLVLDESCVFMDSANAYRLMCTLSEYAKSTDTCCLVVSHVASACSRHVDSTIVLDQRPTHTAATGALISQPTSVANLVKKRKQVTSKSRSSKDPRLV